jgi:hypothetical protein
MPHTFTFLQVKLNRLLHAVTSPHLLAKDKLLRC